MCKKYIFVDLDGTVIDHANEEIPKSTKEAIKQARENGHEVIINTGRPPCLFYGIEKELGVDSYVAANGRYAVHNGEVILNSTIATEDIKEIIDYCNIHKIDLGYEGLHEFKRQSSYTDLYKKFSEHFHLEVPELDTMFYQNNDIYQLTLYYDKNDWNKFNELFPKLSFAYSCPYGIDVNTPGGLKEQGIKAFMKRFNIPLEDVIAIGDGHNDITMFEFVKTSVAMGNAKDFVKQYTTHITDHVSDDGFYKAFKMLGLI